ncbi:SRPBCC domain-containing protein [Chitinophaga sp. SYP-B3965]|uniref:SRPBCC family protein n=1 Tax=Chitinophaga sp. SYP-B3965 TaxID=2663120 RepID=UPI0020A6CAB2|nr:SRPBCC domain-containing protein [Chitinophaga sp. SYP-B3965]
MGGPEMEIKVNTDWKINSPILIQGFHHVKFENKGTILQYDKGNKLSYTHLSNVSRLPDIPENYSILTFVLTQIEEKTALTINIENFPTEVIRKHLEFYWRGTVMTIKKMAEENETNTERISKNI